MPQGHIIIDHKNIEQIRMLHVVIHACTLCNHKSTHVLVSIVQVGLQAPHFVSQSIPLSLERTGGGGT